MDPKAVLKSQDLEGEEMLDDKESNFIILQGPQMWLAKATQPVSPRRREHKAADFQHSLLLPSLQPWPEIPEKGGAWWRRKELARQGL